MSDANAAAEQRAACIRRLDETVERIRALLAEDLRGYPEREMRRRFTADPVRAETITDGALAQLRKEATALGGSLVEELGAVLAEDSLWRGGPADLPGTRDLRQVSHIWASLAPVDEQVEALAGRCGLGGDDREPAGYAPPARFIGGQHLPTLVETYVRELGTLRRLEEQVAEEVAMEQKRSLNERWARAGEEG